MAGSRDKQKVYVRKYPFDAKKKGRHKITEAEVETVRRYLPDWTPDNPKYLLLRDIFMDELNYSGLDCKDLTFDDAVGILRRRSGNSMRELVDRMTRRASENMKEHMPLWNKQRREIRKVAESVDKLVMDPITMRHWRKHVEETLGPTGRIKEEEDWFQVLPNIDPNKDIGVLYTILAFCHDDNLRINPILTDRIRKLNPEMCRSPGICVYLRRNTGHSLKTYFVHVVRDLTGDSRNDQTGKGLAKLDEADLESPEQNADNNVSPPKGKSKLKPWNEDSLDYIPCSEAIAKFTDSKMPLPTLSKKLTPNGQIRYMRKGRRGRVHIGDFRAYLKNHPEYDLSTELADEMLADIDTRKEEEHRRKSHKK